MTISDIPAIRFAASAAEDDDETDFTLSEFRHNYHQVRQHTLDAATRMWHAGGGTPGTSAHIASVVTGGQQLVSLLAQRYARNHLGAKFTTFTPGPGILERPGVSKVSEYMRPLRELSPEAELRRLETLVNTDLQLAKVRTFYSAFDEDLNVNREPIKLFRRVTGGNPCALCEIAADQVYFSDDLAPIHDNCQCDIEEDTGERLTPQQLRHHHIGFVETLLATGDQKEVIQTLADHDAPASAYHNLVKVRQHGELGPVLTWEGQEFTGPGDLPKPVEPRPLPGMGAAHEKRIAENQARVEQYRSQYAVGTRPETAPTRRGEVIPITRPAKDFGTVEVTLGPKELSGLIDWQKSDVPSLINFMKVKYGERIGGFWGFNPESANPVAARRTLQAIDEMMTKYPTTAVGMFRVGRLSEGTVAMTTSARESGRTESMTFNRTSMKLRPETMKKHFEEQEGHGLYFPGASEDPYRAMVYHEYGHVLDSRGGWVARRNVDRVTIGMFMRDVDPAKVSTDADLEREFAKWLAPRVSGYSMMDYAAPGKISPRTHKVARVVMDDAEALAQAFDDVERRGPAASDLSKALHDRLVHDASGPMPTEYMPREKVASLPALREFPGAAKDIDQTVYDTIKANGGITMDLEGHAPVKGYAYAPEKATEHHIPMDKMTVEDVDRYIEDHWTQLHVAGNHIGAWTEGDDYVLDVSRVGPASPATIAAAQKASQLAVFDLGVPVEQGNIDIGTIDKRGRYKASGEASSLHDQHGREVQRASESRSAPSPPEVPRGEAPGRTAALRELRSGAGGLASVGPQKISPEAKARARGRNAV